MAMAPKVPKKKYEYFDGGRGISDLQFDEYNDTSDNSSSPQTHSYSVSPSESSSMLYSPFGDSRPEPEPERPIDYSSTSRIISPISFQHQPSFPSVPYQDFCQSPILNGASQQGYANSSATYRELQERYPGDLPRPSWRLPESPESYNHHGIRENYANYSLQHSLLVEEEEDDIRREQSRSSNSRSKRPQKCRMCSNHGKTVDMKGHKWYCPHRDCDCDQCDITRKTQYYMKERQKLTRHQQQQNDDGMSFQYGYSESRSRRVLDNSHMDFPRVDEMVSQTENILDYDLFSKVNEACRPKSSNTYN